MKKVLKLILIGISMLVFVGSFLSAASIYAYTDGESGVSQIGCGACHDNEGRTAQVNITGLPMQYTPDENYTLTITVTSDDVPGTKGGFDLSVTTGSLSTTDPNAQIVNATEAMHQNDNARSWQVNWTAPTEGEVTFYVAGLAANDAAGPSGDAWDTYSTAVPIIPEFPGVTLLLVLAAVTIMVLFFTRKSFPRFVQ